MRKIVLPSRVGTYWIVAYESGHALRVQEVPSLSCGIFANQEM